MKRRWFKYYLWVTRLPLSPAVLRASVSGTALRLAEAGAAVAIFDIQEENEMETVAGIGKIGGMAKFFYCDVTSDPDCQRAVAAAIAVGWTIRKNGLSSGGCI